MIFSPRRDTWLTGSGFSSPCAPMCAPRGVEIPWDDLKAMEDLDLINLLTAHLPLPSEDKQALIETINLVDRAELMRGLMDMASASSVEGVEQRH